MTQNAIEIKALTKTYKASGKSPQKTALHGVDLTIPKGSIFGLLGPNGAGKSTIINIMAGLVVKTSGSVRIWGYDIDENLRQAKSCIGVVPQEINYDPFFSPAKLLELQAGMYGVPKVERRTMEILKLVGLEDKANAYTRSLSGGMRRRLMVAKAMVHSPPILVLDEPTAGVDVELRKQLWANVRELNRRGVTILLTTHYLEEAEELCDHIAIIHQGRIVVNEDTQTLLARVDAKELIIRLDRELPVLPPALTALGGALEGDRRSIRFRYNPKEANAGALITAVQAENLGIVDLSTDEADLEDVFLRLTR
jgi:ABC-2 type transport system ATP-binding protein